MRHRKRWEHSKVDWCDPKSITERVQGKRWTVSAMLLLTPTAPLSGEQKWKMTPELTHGLLSRGQWCCKERMEQGTQHDGAGAGIASPGTYSSFQGLFHVRKRGRALETWKKRQLPVLLDNKSGAWPSLACSKMATILQSFVFFFSPLKK